MTAEPWQAPSEPLEAAGRAPLDLTPVWRALPLALPLTAGATLLRVALVPSGVPAVPATVALGLAGTLLGVGTALAVVRRRLAPLWVAALAGPLVLLAAVSAIGETAAAEVAGPLSAMAARWVWACTFDAVAVWLWVDGRRSGLVSLPTFAAAYALKAQLVDVGLQLLLPGLLLVLLLPLVEIGVARGRTVPELILDTGRRIGVASFVVGAWFLTGALGLGLTVLAAGAPLGDGFSRALIDPLGLPFGARALGETVAMSSWGLALAIGGALYDQQRSPA